MDIKHEQDWDNPPEPEVRRCKTAMEDELLIERGVKRENIEFHPLIKNQRRDRTSTSLSLNYLRVKPPYREQPRKARNAWMCNNVALRQMSDLARRGPRKVSLDATFRAGSRRVQFPPGDPEYHKKRAARFRKLADLLTEWRVYHQLAFELPEEDQLDIDKLDTLRRVSTSTASSARLRSVSRQRSSASSASLRIRSAKVRKRTMAQKWINMKREMLINLKAARLQLNKQIPKSEVRIYLTATPDMAEEREFLAEVAYPELRRYCEKVGINCHVVDLRTGSDKLANDLMTFKICEAEMEKCRKLSVGPTFVCLVGEQLEMELPGFMSRDELEKIREVVIKRKIDGVELLDEYYRLDSNKLNPHYELARDDLYNLPEPEEAVTELKDMLVAAMDILREDGVFGKKTLDFYKWSMCAKEVETGLLGCKDPSSQLLCLMRDSNTETHESGFSNLHTILMHYFENNRCEENIVGISRGRKTLNYMRNLTNVFLVHVINLIERNLDLQYFYMSDHLSETSDMIQHVQHQKDLIKNYQNPNNEDLQLQFKDILENPGYRRTVVICGDRGSGKSTFASHIAECSVGWNKECNTVIRFLGRSLRTSTLYHTLISICKQIAFLYTQIVRIPVQSTLVEMMRIFRTLLKDASEEPDCGPLVIILDGLENVHDLHPHHVWGLVDDLPLRVSLILTVDRQHPYMKLLKANPQPAEFLTIQGISGDTRKEIIETVVSASGKKITDDQMNMILKHIQYEESPLTLKTAAVIACHWPSSILPELRALDSPVDAFEQLIEDTENSEGVAFTKYVLSFLQTSKFGLADSELLHLVLSDSELLNQLQIENTNLSVLDGYPYQAQLSKVLLWISPFLEERKVEGETLKKIGHKSLETAIQNRYLADDFLQVIHKQMASFFQYTRRGLLLTAKEITEGIGYSLVSQNWRNLRSIPYHLCHSNSNVETALNVLKETVLLNFSWIINEVYSGYLNEFLADLKYSIDKLQVDEDIFLIRRLLIILKPVIEENPSSLASIVSQFPSHHSKYFNDFIEQSKDWMKQVHSALLIPSPSSGFFSGSFYYGNVTTKSDRLLPSEDGLYLVSIMEGRFDSIEMGTGECLASVEASIQRPHVWGKYRLTGIMDNALKTWDIHGGKLLRKVPLGINRVTWLEVFGDGTVYFAADNQIKRLHAITGTPVTVIKAPQQIRDAGMSHRTVPTIATVHMISEWCVRIWETSDPQNFTEIPLEEKALSNHCRLLHMTNDGKYAVFMYEREAVILAILDLEVETSLNIDNEVLQVVIFTRSHDHVFLASNSGKIRGHLLNSGTQLFTATVQSDSNKRKTGQVSAMTTSEDDHFLVVGMSTGMVIVINIPSAQRIKYITSHVDPITQVYYMTDQIHFQHLITLDKTGTSKLWNLQNILRSAREEIFQLMWDDDLIQEESQKIDLPSYYTLYTKKSKSKMFLNGPDVSAFYNKTSENVVASAQSVANSGTSWEQSQKLQDCRRVGAVSTAVGRGDIVMTYAEDKMIAWWDVKKENLLSVRPIPHGGRFHRLRAVYFDRAACLITRDPSDRETITVCTFTSSKAQAIMTTLTYLTEIVYGADKQKRSIVREKVLRCDTSADLKKLATVTVSRQGFQLTVIDIGSEEEHKYTLYLGNIAGTVSVDKARVTLSKELTVILGFLKVEDRTLVISWEVGCSAEEKEGSARRTGSVQSSGTNSSKGDVINYANMTELNLKITKSRFYTDTDVLLGTRDGEIFIIDSSTLKVIKAFTKDAIVSCKGVTSGLSKPHRSSVRSIYFTHDYIHLLTSDSTKLCVWNMRRKVMVYSPAAGDKMANAVLSQEGCFTVAGLVTGVVRMWANYHRKLLYSFRIPTTLYQVALTPDNARVVALVDENNGRRVVVFETKNIDDYLLDTGDGDSCAI